jgi:hypothetical protein
MTAALVLEQATRKIFRPQALSKELSRLPGTSRLTTRDKERREVLESVRRAMGRKTMEPACSAACGFLLQHLARG